MRVPFLFTLFINNKNLFVKTMKKQLLTLVSALLVIGSANAQKYQELAKTPQMGWNSWNKFACDINEDLIRETADALVYSGLRDAGYIYLNLDDCWHGQRDSLGFIHEDPERFPSGLAVLAEYCHNRGLKLGIYSDAGRQTCAGRPGSFGHEYQDAIQYAKWGIDYLKYDWCYNNDINPKGAYGLMSEALKAAGRPILFSMCEWGTNNAHEWAEPIAHSWRTTGDIGAQFAGEFQFNESGWRPLTVLQCMDINAELRKYAGPGHWNDPDMLEVGNGLTDSENRAHFTMWCMMASPLILGNDLTNMPKEVLNVITNKDVIAINQDILGVQGMRIERIGDLEVWLKPLEGEDWAFCILNRGEEAASITLDWEKWNTVDSEVSGREISFTNTVYNLRNLWAADHAKVVGSTKTKKPVVATIPSHDVLLYRLSPKPTKK